MKQILLCVVLLINVIATTFAQEVFKPPVGTGIFPNCMIGQLCGGDGIRVHNGIDYLPKATDISGDIVKAVASGIVVFSKITFTDEANHNLGYVVIVEHTLSNGQKVLSLYAHLHTISVEVGDFVSQGDQIGTMGETGEGANDIVHLHFEIKKSFNYGDAVEDFPHDDYSKILGNTQGGKVCQYQNAADNYCWAYTNPPDDPNADIVAYLKTLGYYNPEDLIGNRAYQIQGKLSVTQSPFTTTSTDDQIEILNPQGQRVSIRNNLNVALNGVTIFVQLIPNVGPGVDILAQPVNIGPNETIDDIYLNTHVPNGLYNIEVKYQEYGSSNFVTITDFGGKKFLLNTPAPEIEETFFNVSNDWARPYIEKVVHEGLFNGPNQSNTRFNGDLTITQGEVAVVVARAAKALQRSGFTNINFDSFEKAESTLQTVLETSLENIITNYSRGTTCSRIQLCEFIYKLALVDPSNSTASNFDDTDNSDGITDDQRRWINTLVDKSVYRNGKCENQLISGNEGNFLPLNSITRSEVAKIIANTILHARNGNCNLWQKWVGNNYEQTYDNTIADVQINHPADVNVNPGQSTQIVLSNVANSFAYWRFDDPQDLVSITGQSSDNYRTGTVTVDNTASPGDAVLVRGFVGNGGGQIDQTSFTIRVNGTTNTDNPPNPCDLYSTYEPNESISEVAMSTFPELGAFVVNKKMYKRYFCTLFYFHNHKFLKKF